MTGFDAGSVITTFKADMTNFNQGLKQAQGEVANFGDKMKGIGQAVSNFATQASIVSAVVGTGLTLFLKDASQEANSFEKSMIALDVIATRFNVNGKKAQQTAQGLATELRIGVGSAADGLQNLLKSGLSLDKAADLMRRFTNEAAIGRSSSIDLSTAVQNLSFAYATGNSALGNMSGISENWSDITEKGRQILIKKGKALSDISDEEAKYAGIIELTNQTVGASARLHGTYADKQAQLQQQITNLKVAIGQELNPVLAQFLDFIMTSGIIDGIKEFAKQISGFIQSLAPLGEWMKQHKEIVLTFFTGFAAAIAAILIIAPLVMLALNPFALVFAGIATAIGLLYTAWQTNFLGIQDITMAFVELIKAMFGDMSLEIQVVWNIIKDITVGVATFIYTFFVEWTGRLRAIWKEYGEDIMQGTRGAWEIIKGIIQFALGVIGAIVGFAVNALRGDWDAAWQAVVRGTTLAMKGIENMLNGGVNFIKGWGGTLIRMLVSPFEEAWGRIQDLVNKIKDALDFTKRHSPSVVDIVNAGVGKVNHALEQLDYGLDVSPHASAIGMPAFAGGGGGGMITSINIDMGNAIISDEAGAARIAEKIGDSIMRKLKLNIRT